ncbi:MAG: hypothetical protein JO165_04360 [Candidatus Eremiobacteraeota bacterium]|nr:hypothetical protein [Candidatus Eremiobacteraeota bacterium]
MRGGITSGVVYPSAILRIAQRFRMKNIGGTSAGAIAAAAAAAAEFRRSCMNGGGAGFVALRDDVMLWIGRGKNLQSLFVPQNWWQHRFLGLHMEYLAECREARTSQTLLNPSHLYVLLMIGGANGAEYMRRIP